MPAGVFGIGGGGVGTGGYGVAELRDVFLVDPVVKVDEAGDDVGGAGRIADLKEAYWGC